MCTKLASMVLAVALSGCHGRPTVERSTPIGPGVRHDLDLLVVTAPGIVEPWSGEVRLSTAEPGLLIELAGVEGQAVRRGDLLARLEDSRQRGAVAVAEAELRQATAALEGMSSTPEEVRAAEAELRAATLRAEEQGSQSRRATTLASSGALPPAEAERALAATRVDDATRVAAEARFRAARRGARPSDRKLARAGREAALARLDDARAALARREVRAPLDGVVLWSRYHVGEFYAQVQGPLFVLGQLERLQVRLEVDDGDATRVSTGAACTLRSDDGTILGDGTVSRIALECGSRSLTTERPTGRADARVREVWVTLARPARVTPGQRVWGTLSSEVRQAAR